MSARKTPILLRRGPLSERIYAFHRYTRKVVGDREILRAAFDGKQDVSSDFYALLLMELLDPDSPNIVVILDGVADGEALTGDERAEVRAFRERLRGIVDRHNARLEGHPNG